MGGDLSGRNGSGTEKYFPREREAMEKESKEIAALTEKVAELEKEVKGIRELRLKDAKEREGLALSNGSLNTMVKDWNEAYEKLKAEKEKLERFPQHIRTHFKDEHPDWHVECKICHKTFEEITGTELKDKDIIALSAKEAIAAIEGEVKKLKCKRASELDDSWNEAIEDVLAIIEKFKEGKG